MIDINLTINEIESKINSLDYSSIEHSIYRDYIKCGMLEVIQVLLPSAKAIDYHYNNISVSFKEDGYKTCEITFSLGVTKTGITKKVGRLKSKDVVKPAKVTVKYITVEYEFPVFSNEVTDDYLVSIKDDWTRMSNSFNLPFKGSDKLLDLLNKEYLTQVFNYEEDVLQSLKTTMAQPWIHKRFFGMQEEFTQEEFDSIVKFVSDKNIELIKEIENKIYTK